MSTLNPCVPDHPIPIGAQMPHRSSRRAPRTSRLASVTVLAVGLLLLTATGAAAHPFIRGGEAPVASLASLELDLAHGCGVEDDGHADGDAAGDGEPTTDVALEVPEVMRIVEVPEPDGWQVELERDDDGRVEVVSWVATTGAEPAPVFDLDVVIDGEPGDELYLRVFQACDEVTYRWVGTPDDPAEDPAVRLRLIDADPDRPAPDPEPPVEEAPADAEEPATEQSEDAADADGPADEVPLVEGVEDPEDLDASPIAVPDDGETNPLLWVVVGLVVALLLVAVVLALRRRPVADGAPADGRRADGDAADEGR